METKAKLWTADNWPSAGSECRCDLEYDYTFATGTGATREEAIANAVEKLIEQIKEK
jgi:hypothetical protein